MSSDTAGNSNEDQYEHRNGIVNGDDTNGRLGA